jgi:hypothetical protein|nr:MAG TPA: hypothetical protein [Crassvirales sp.]
MVDAESKIKTNVKSKRIRHAYPRRELYHRWIHSPEYVYVNNSRQISGKGNYLRIGDIGKDKSTLCIERDVDVNYSTFAVIDRTTSRILISDKYLIFALELLRALPNEYEVFRCHGAIPCHDILSEKHTELLCKIHLEYLIKKISGYLYPYYAALKGRNVLHCDIDTEMDKNKETLKLCNLIYRTDNILAFVKKYKIKQYDWYNKTLDPNYELNSYYSNPRYIVRIKLPTVKQIVTGTIFNKSQIELFKKKRFYTKYCYGRGISFKNVNKYWNKTVAPLNTNSTNDNSSYDLTYNQVKQFFQVNKVYWNDDFYNNNLITWNNYIILANQKENEKNNEYIKENIEKSKQNELKAREELKKYIGTDYLKHWRDNKGLNVHKYVEYEKFIKSKYKSGRGSWNTVKLYLNYRNAFANIQLKLHNDTIITSNDASVPINEAVRCYKILQVCKEKYNKEGKKTFSFVEQNIHIGIYKLIEISYTRKYDDNCCILPITTWLIRIGCHRIWLDDFENFVHYYNLEDTFGIKQDIENNRLN